MTEAELKAYTVDIPNDLQEIQKRAWPSWWRLCKMKLRYAHSLSDTCLIAHVQYMESPANNWCFYEGFHNRFNLPFLRHEMKRRKLAMPAYVIQIWDNRLAGCRETWKEGRLIAWCTHEALEKGLYPEEPPWGTWPDKPGTPDCTGGLLLQ